MRFVVLELYFGLIWFSRVSNVRIRVNVRIKVRVGVSEFVGYPYCNQREERLRIARRLLYTQPFR